MCNNDIARNLRQAAEIPPKKRNCFHNHLSVKCTGNNRHPTPKCAKKTVEGWVWQADDDEMWEKNYVGLTKTKP